MRRGPTSSPPTRCRLRLPRRPAVIAISLLLPAVLGWGSCRPAPREASPEPLHLGLHGDPSSLDPHLQSELVAQSLLGNVFDSLVSFDVNMQPNGALAESWESPDRLTWRFHLRHDVRFHDGRDLTSADVVYSFERARSHPQSKTASHLVAIDEIHAVDDHTVEIRTKTPYPILLTKLAFVQVVPRDSPETIRHPIGTGPYRFVDFEEGRLLRLVANPAGWRGAPSVTEVVFHFVEEPQERLDRLLAGELDLIDDVRPEEAERIENEPDFAVESRSGLSVSYIQMDVHRPPFDDPRVREALDLLLDRDELVRETLHGQGQPLGQMLSPNVFGYAPEIGVVERDVERARRLLAEAGHGDGLALVLELRAGREEDATPVVRQLAAGGVRVDLRPLPWSEMYQRLATRQVAFYFGDWICSSGDASDLFDDKVHTPDPERGYGTANSNNFSDPELDRLIETSARVDMEERREVFRQALVRLVEARTFLPLLTPFDLYGVRHDLEWVPRLDGQIYVSEMRRR